eukprot:CAMPEP_0185607166 /NCGR_PEP_ID=MMETSP0436-20130131/5325_1 /TAXON_ID=626734 ORGANISM="Favella taraikaensis, Strain Fe Narragansett Bay" /NCGR_SAMPLE_ID=MMETSP0436 /ASSEMBLY_ACC=CAM_ASM_000390 /LENGTH=58 /DNA_ID=CAMNT_0028239017 /DNA_START=694 /DNA_END=870 /DNA_ORIENTATION=-
MRAGRQDFVRAQPDPHFLELEDVVDLADQLHRKLLLAHIIVGFDDNAEQTPGLQMSEW